MRHNTIEILMGAIVLSVAGFFLFFAYSSSGYKNTDGVNFTAKFDRVDGLNVGSDVKMSGVKIGTVRTMTVDPKTFLAAVTLSVAPQIQLPKDTSVEVVTDGLLGSKYLALVPGGDEENLKPGDTIKYTQSSVSLENLIGKFMFSNKDGKKDEGKKEATPDAPPAASVSPTPTV